MDVYEGCGIQVMHKHTYLQLYGTNRTEKKNKVYTKPHITTMPPQPHTIQEDSLPRKRQAPLDDNGEPVTLPAIKKKKSVEQNGPKKKVPTKSQAKPKGKRTMAVSKTVPSEAPASRKPSEEISMATSNNPASEEPLMVESADEEVIDNIPDDIPEEPEESDEAELGMYLFFI